MTRARLRKALKGDFLGLLWAVYGLARVGNDKGALWLPFFVPSGMADGVILGKRNGGFVGGCWRRF